MVQVDGLAVPDEGVGMPVAGVEVGVGEHLAGLAAVAVQPEAVEGVADERGVAGAGVVEAGGEAVVVVLAGALGMALAAVEDFVGDGVAAGGVEGVEDGAAAEQHADGAPGKQRGCAARAGSAGRVKLRVWAAMAFGLRSYW